MIVLTCSSCAHSLGLYGPDKRSYGWMSYQKRPFWALIGGRHLQDTGGGNALCGAIGNKAGL